MARRRGMGFWGAARRTAEPAALVALKQMLAEPSPEEKELAQRRGLATVLAKEAATKSAEAATGFAAAEEARKAAKERQRAAMAPLEERIARAKVKKAEMDSYLDLAAKALARSDAFLLAPDERKVAMLQGLAKAYRIAAEPAPAIKLGKDEVILKNDKTGELSIYNKKQKTLRPR